MSQENPHVVDPLWSDYAIENCELMRSYAVSAGEALARGNVETAKIFFDCMKLTGKEISVAFKNLEAE